MDFGAITDLALALFVLIQIGRNASLSNQATRLETRIIVLENMMTRVLAERNKQDE